MKFRSAQVSGDFSTITDEDISTMRAKMGNIYELWQGFMWLAASTYLSYPLFIINKYAYCKLSNRPFVWLSTYTLDLLSLSSFLYAFRWHVVWLYEENSGLGLEPDPS